jgi:DNA-binding protein
VSLTDTYDEKVIEDYSKVVSGEKNISNGYNISKDIDTYNSVYYTLKYTNEEVLQLARLISLKARGEGINCWTAIAQVMKNRISSDMFPNTLMEVINLEASDYELENQEPTQEMINISRMVLSGKLKILERSDVLFYYDTRDVGDSEIEYEDEETEENLEEEVSEDTFILPDCQYSETIGCYIFYSF